jgi:hypothetical protein
MEQVGSQDFLILMRPSGASGCLRNTCSGLPSPHGGQDPQDRQDVVAVDEVHDESDTA